MANGKQLKIIRLEALYINYTIEYTKHFVSLIKTKQIFSNKNQNQNWHQN